MNSYRSHFERNCTVRRSKSFELREVLPKGSLVGDVKLPVASSRRKHSLKRRWRNSIMVKDTDSLASTSTTVHSTGHPDSEKSSSSSSSSTLSRVKAALGKLRTSDSHRSLILASPSEQHRDSADPNANHVPASDKGAKMRPKETKDRIEHCQRELKLAIRYLREVIRTGKLEMLGGSSCAILDAVVKLLVVLNEKGCLLGAGETLKRGQKGSLTKACTRVYKALVQLLKWADETLLNLATGEETLEIKPARNRQDMTELETLGGQLQTTINELLVLIKLKSESETESKRISADSGTGASLQEDNLNNNLDNLPPKPQPPSETLRRGSYPPPLPPRKKVTVTPDRRRNSPPVSGDSGIFNESLNLSPIEADDSGGTGSGGPNMLDDILKQLNLSDSISAPSNSISEIDDSGFAEHSQFFNGSTNVTEQKTEEILNGRKVTVSRVHVQRAKHTKTTATATVSAGNSESDLLKLLRESKDGKLRITEKQNLKFRRVYGANLMTKSMDDKLSPYDNNKEEEDEIAELPTAPEIPKRLSFSSDYDNNMDTPSSNDNSPEQPCPGPSTIASKVIKTERLMHHSSSLQSINRKALVNGQVVAKQFAKKYDNSQFDVTKSDTFKDGALVDRQGSGFYTETGYCKGDREIVPPPKNKKQTPPPIPPKKRHVAMYMDIVRPHSEALQFQDSETEGEADIRRSTLASYVILRDKWRQHEEAYRQKTCSFQYSGSPQKGSYSSYSRRSASPSFLLSDLNVQYKNLTEFLNWTEDIHFPKRIEKSPDSGADKKALSYERRLALPCASVLGSLDGSEGLLMRKTCNDTQEVYGGTVDGLIVYATQPGSQVVVYQEAFLTTYRTFIEPLDLIQRLVWRYQHFDVHRERDQAKRKAARNTFSLIVCVVDDLSGYEMRKELLSVVNLFIYRLVEDGELNLARLLRQRLVDRIEDKAGFKNRIHLSMMSSMIGASPEQSSKPLSFMDVKCEHLAEQLTRIDADLFNKIEISEMLWWAQEQCEEKSPNLVNFTEHFNKMSYWTRTRVLEHQEQKDRERTFVKFIKIMKHLKRMGNFNSFLAILSALESGPVRRLEWSKNITEAMKELSEIMDSSQSFKKYRTALAETKPPCLPYIGLILQDLTFVHVGNKNYVRPENVGGQTNILNFGKRWQQYTILDSVRKFKAWPFEIKRDEDVVAVFANFESYLSEDSIWEVSESIKPRPSGRRNFAI